MVNRQIVLLGIAACAVACGAAETGDGETSAQSSSALINGTVSDSSQNEVVSVAVDGARKCTGTLISPTLVITSQHCFTTVAAVAGAETVNNIVGCSLPTSPATVSRITVAIGATYSAPVVPVSHLFFNVNNTDCTRDIAIIELTTPVTGMKQHPLLLDSIPPVGESVTEIGWGYTEVSDGGYSSANLRQQETGTILLSQMSGAVPVREGGTVSVPAGYIVTTVMSCDGDSGAPVFDANGALLSVQSSIESTKVANVYGTNQSDCSDDVSISAPLNTDVAFIESAFQATGKMPWRVGQASPPADVGGSCAKNNDCNSNECVFLGAGPTGYCSTACSADTDCTGGTVCTATGVAADAGGQANVCLPAQPAASARGCAVVSAKGALSESGNAGQWLAGVIAGLAFVRRRPRRSRDARKGTHQ